MYITDCLNKEPQFKHLIDMLNADKHCVYLHGMVKESTGHFLVSLLENVKRPVFVVTEKTKRALELEEELHSIADGRSEAYIENEPNFFNFDSVSSSVIGSRLRVMSRLANNEKIIVTTTLSALNRKITPKKVFRDSDFIIHDGDEIEVEDLILKLHFMSYERVMTVDHRGQYSVRGGIVDIFPVFGNAFRIEFFDNEIDSIRIFDVNTQRSIEKIETVRLSPAAELQYSDDEVKAVVGRCRKELIKQRNKPVEGRNDVRAEDKFSSFLNKIEENCIVLNQDLISAYLDSDAYEYIINYLPDDAIIVFEDISRIIDEEKIKEERLKSDITNLIERGEILKSHADTFLSYQDVFSKLKKFSTLNLTQILKRNTYLKADLLLQVRSVEVEKFDNRWNDFLETIKRRIDEKYSIILAVGNAVESLNLRFLDSNIKTYRLTDEDIAPGRIYLSNYTYPQGFRYPDSKIVIFTNREIFGKEKKTAKHKKTVRKDFLSYQDLSNGDYVVHETYGVGVYLGTKSMDIQGVTKDFITIQYRGSDVLYVAVDEMDMVTKYIGNDGKTPKLSTLGGVDWGKAKARAQKAIDKIADDLVELYAQRSKIKGFKFSEDSPWQRDFENAFSYEETPSQLRAIAEIKEDMETDHPMDRLLCGDVGYGKTEVALRAAFKAIMDGKQVAFLCPTTILTQQHYSTMLDRFQAFPIREEFLSRFKSPAQQKEIIKEIQKGSVDIVVGTHRLLSKDVKFKDLGLLIIDEEQRFGVKDKEKIKKLKENIDVLTLSATPIPRTLQLSLTGIRSMSILEEPPEERYPTTTYIMEYEADIIRDAIHRELDRGGQIFFVYNRVHDIHYMAERIRELVPEASMAVAHGKMTTRELENVMDQFVSGNIDILLSTTIIETGMDIPNVNTLIVYNSDKMGLSQLYQLKGRIGRSDRRAYAYFTYEKNKVISEASEKRLKAIKDFTEFGSGYKIAMRDLELRGAGNLLGESQSGHIESIGYELYVKMLEERVNSIKGGTYKKKLEETTVDMKVDAYIQNDYIPQNVDKIMMYRKIAEIENEEQYQTVVEELIDRFGDVPSSVKNIMDVALMKKMATVIGFKKIIEKGDFVELQYEKFEKFSVEFLKQIAENYKGPLSFDFKNVPKFKIASTMHKCDDINRLLQLMLKIKEETS